MATSSSERVYQVLLFFIDFIVFLFKANWLILKSLYQKFVPPVEKSVEGEIVLITGGGHGLGRKLALMFAEKRAKIVLWDINLENCQKAADEISNLGCKAYAFQCDVSSKDDVAKVAQEVRRQVGHPSILVNNAGIITCQPFLNIGDQQLHRIVGVNVFSNFWTVREFLPAMLQSKKGHIVCISSMAGVSGSPNLVDYGTTKFAVTGFMKHLRAELQSQDNRFINCTTIHPTIINTGMIQKTRSRYDFIKPVIDVEYAAGVIMDAILKNKVVCFVPPGQETLHCILNLYPQSVQDAFRDFIGIGILAQD